MRTEAVRWITLAGLVCCVMAAGCGGRSGGAAQEQTVTYGRMVTRLIGTAQTPVVASSLGSVVTGVAGANITSLTLTSAANGLADTRIAYYGTDSQAPGLYLISPFGGDPYRAWTNGFGISEPSWSRDGTVLISDGSVRQVSPRQTDFTDGTSNTVFLDQTAVTNNPSNITTILGDGSVRQLTTTNKDTNPAWWPSNRICFESWRDGNNQIYVMNSDGTGQTRLTINAFADTSPCWSPDGNWIGFVSNRNGVKQVFQMVSDGTSQTLLIGETKFDCWDPQYSPDGSRICYVTNKDGNSEIYVADAFGGNRTRITTNTTSDYDPSWSPDGTMLCYTHINAAGFPEVWTASASGNNLKQIGLATHAGRPYWSPFAPTRTLVGAKDAVLGASASGFLYGQKGDSTTSVVVFDTATPGGAHVSSLTASDSNGPNFVFEVTSADSIRSLQFTNDFYRRPVTVVSTPLQDVPPPQPTGALVTFNATTGKVSSVLPYIANRSAANPPTPTRSGISLVYRRQFTAAFDDSGKNLAPSGASEAHIDAATGKLLSFH